MNLFLLFKKISLLLLLISASLLSTSFAGRQLVTRNPENNLANQEVDEIATHEDVSKKPPLMEEDAGDEEDISNVHERLLRANRRDYGKYDPAPALVRPPFKLIPN